MMPYGTIILALGAASVVSGVAIKGTQMVVDNHYKHVSERCAEDINSKTYKRCPVEIAKALTDLDLDRVETVIEYRDRIIKVQDSTAVQQAAQIKELQRDITSLQAMKNETVVIDSPYIDAARRQLCDRAGDCPAPRPATVLDGGLRPRTLPSDLP